MNLRVILPRDSHEETTFAVVEFAGCPGSELLARLRRAVRLWAETEEGQDALAEASGDFNVGDLAEHTPAGSGQEDDLSRCLVAAGITYLDIDVYSQEGVARGWSFDTPLA
jgi:hypothetical protein